MNRRDSQNEKLSRIERELLEAGKIADEEIETIVGAPQLYRRIREKIAAEKSRREPARTKVSVLSRFQFRNRRAAALAAALAILISAAAFLIRVTPPGTPPAAAIAEKQPAPATSESPSERARPQNPEPAEKELPPREIASARKAKSKTVAPVPLPPPRRTKPSPPRLRGEPEAPFVALTFAGDFEPDEERRIVRVELPPAQLLALGVAVQTENEGEKIKTDLLVGADGVARAIRVVK